MNPTDPNQQSQLNPQPIPQPQMQPQPQPQSQVPQTETYQPQPPVAPQPAPQAFVPQASPVGYQSASSGVDMVTFVPLVAGVVAIIASPIIGSLTNSVWWLIVPLLIGAGGATFAIFNARNKSNLGIVELTGLILSLLITVMMFTSILQYAITIARIKSMTRSASSAVIIQDR